jgi:hypothetical protein
LPKYFYFAVTLFHRWSSLGILLGSTLAFRSDLSWVFALAQRWPALPDPLCSDNAAASFEHKFGQFIHVEINKQRKCNAQFDAQIVTSENTTQTTYSNIDKILDCLEVFFPASNKMQQKHNTSFHEESPYPGWHSSSHDNTGSQSPCHLKAIIACPLWRVFWVSDIHLYKMKTKLS